MSSAPQTAIFIHGALHDRRAWAAIAETLAREGRQAVALDLPAHGSNPGAALSSVEAMADGVVTYLEQHGIERAALIGHSMGSLIALEVSARAGHRVTQLVMVATAFPMAVSPALLAAAQADPQSAIDKIVSYSLPKPAPDAPSPLPDQAIRDRTRALMQSVQAQSAHANLLLQDLAACNAYARGLETAARIACPTTLILGTRDRMTAPSQAHALAQALKARVIELNCGHLPMDEVPGDLLDALRGVLG